MPFLERHQCQQCDSFFTRTYGLRGRKPRYCGESCRAKAEHARIVARLVADGKLVEVPA
ncbi:hypothetical protein EV189_3670 [Motilibacter rhizosphaerae]|uniref:Uncharacterized protein n=1 Tax=Motilibacter rhizosphaerae TaxID=598652 RepID=A0A4Q7NB45_9ACTN|nr:hypothetical protein EV189_3670 [Motilibacter rhizosphaerae]